MNTISVFCFIQATFLISDAILVSDPSNFAQKSFAEPDSMSSKCNVFDEAHYCKMVIIDTSLTTVAESHKCECPDNFRCPTDSEDTKLEVRCHYDGERQRNRCFLPCTPLDL